MPYPRDQEWINPVSQTLEDLYVEQEERYDRIDRLVTGLDSDRFAAFAAEFADEERWIAECAEQEIYETEIRAAIEELGDHA